MKTITLHFGYDGLIVQVSNWQGVHHAGYFVNLEGENRAGTAIVICAE